MRRVSLIPIVLATCWMLALSAVGQEPSKPAKAPASTMPTIDQSLEWNSAFNPKISPDGKRVVYEVQKANWEDNAFDRSLWIADIATGESHALTSAKKSSTNPAWSPDGKWIAFLSDRPGQITGTPEGKKQLYVISADGGEAQQLTKTENDVNAFDWAPDSKSIVFSLTDQDPKTMRFESGAQSKAFTSFSVLVSCCASPPSAEITYNCFLPAGVPVICPGRSERNAIHFPSGDHAAFVLDFFADVSACDSPVATSAIHKFLSNALSSQLAFCTSYTTRFPSGEIFGLNTLVHSSD